MYYNNVRYENSDNICNAFVEYFSSMYIPPNSIIAPNPTNSNINISSVNVSLAEVFEGLNNLNLDNTYGPDQLLPIILFKCRYALAYPLYLLFNKSFQMAFSHITGN